MVPTAAQQRGDRQQQDRHEQLVGGRHARQFGGDDRRNGNTVTLDSADSIATSGVGNVVTYDSGTPRVVEAGISNTVQRG